MYKSAALLAVVLVAASTPVGAAETSSTVYVHGTDLASAERAVEAAGLQKLTSFRKIGVVAARGTSTQISSARSRPGVSKVEVTRQAKFLGSSGTTATRSREAQQSSGLTGAGVSVAVIDSGVDPTHPAFAGGKIVRSLKSLCAADGSTDTSCIVPVPNLVDTDTTSLGGHGTHVTGIAIGTPYTLADGTQVGGSAPGAKGVVISTGAAILILGADAALNWVLENHNAPCGAGVPASACPPIKVINNSYGPSGGGAFDPASVTVKLQRQLVAEGVVVVWANGNDGGDGTKNLSNPPGQDPTPGVLSVASYNDQGTGTRDGALSSFSSRGLASDSATWPDISAPGENIVSSCRLYLPICSTGLAPQNGPGLLDIGTYNTISGTSMAAPQIAGIVAQLFQAKPSATPADIERALKSTAHKYGTGYQPVGSYTSSFDKGTGLVDVVAAVNAL